MVEGIGDHGCEYMTGGRAVILGETGRNFGAGMSGGIAYVYNPKGSFIKKCNTSTFELEDLVIKEDINELKELISNHYKYTKSLVAEKILLNWTKEVKNFSKVMPTDYKRAGSLRAPLGLDPGAARTRPMPATKPRQTCGDAGAPALFPAQL